MTPFDFIFMLTRNDRTVADAAVHAETALRSDIRHIGFKDVGLPFDALAGLARQIREGGASTYLEVVSLDRDSEIRSVKAAIDLGVDYLLGGTHAEDVLPLLEGTPIRYYPFPGRIVGHPSSLEGSQAEIVKSAVALARHPGVAGLDLLALPFGRQCAIPHRRCVPSRAQARYRRGIGRPAGSDRDYSQEWRSGIYRRHLCAGRPVSGRRPRTGIPAAGDLGVPRRTSREHAAVAQFLIFWRR